MTPVTAVAIGLGLLWLIALTSYAATLRSRRTAGVHGPRRRPSYTEGLERLRTAIAGAHRESRPRIVVMPCLSW